MTLSVRDKGCRWKNRSHREKRRLALDMWVPDGHSGRAVRYRDVCNETLRQVWIPRSRVTDIQVVAEV